MHEILKRRLEAAQTVVVLCVGSELRGDDGAGLLVGQLLEEHVRSGDLRVPVHVVKGGAMPENQSGPIRQLKPTHLLVIDAASTGGLPGEFRLVDPSAIASKAPGFTHRMPLPMLISYLRTALSFELLVIGIEPERMEFRTGISTAVAEGARLLADAIAFALQRQS